MPGVLSGCRWAGQKKHRMQKRPKRIAVLCVFLLTCVKFDLGCGLRLPHSGSPRQIRRRWQAMEGSDASPFLYLRAVFLVLLGCNLTPHMCGQRFSGCCETFTAVAVSIVKVY